MMYVADRKLLILHSQCHGGAWHVDKGNQVTNNHGIDLVSRDPFN